MIWHHMLLAFDSSRSVILLPLDITFYTTWWFIHFVDGFFSPIYAQLGINIFAKKQVATLRFQPTGHLFLELVYDFPIANSLVRLRVAASCTVPTPAQHVLQMRVAKSVTHISVKAGNDILSLQMREMQNTKGMDVKHLESRVTQGPLVVPLDCEWVWHCHRLNPIQL